jgi:hypothetical protein
MIPSFLADKLSEGILVSSLCTCTFCSPAQFCFRKETGSQGPGCFRRSGAFSPPVPSSNGKRYRSLVRRRVRATTLFSWPAIPKVCSMICFSCSNRACNWFPFLLEKPFTGRRKFILFTFGEHANSYLPRQH